MSLVFMLMLGTLKATFFFFLIKRGEEISFPWLEPGIEVCVCEGVRVCVSALVYLHN